MRTRAAPSAARQRAVQHRASSRFHCGSRRRTGARTVLILRTGAVTSNSRCGNELVEPSGVSAGTKGGRIAVACGSHALPQVLRARNAPSAPTRNARRHQSVPHVRTRHGTCYTGPLGYEQRCVLGSLVLRACPAMGRAHQAAGRGLHPPAGGTRGLGGRCALHPRTTTRQATTLVSHVRRAVCALGRCEQLLVDRPRGNPDGVPDLPPAFRVSVADLGGCVVARPPTGAVPSIRLGGGRGGRPHYPRLCVGYAWPRDPWSALRGPEPGPERAWFDTRARPSDGVAREPVAGAPAQRVDVATLPPARDHSDSPHGIPRGCPGSARSPRDHSVDARTPARPNQGCPVCTRCRVAPARE